MPSKMKKKTLRLRRFSQSLKDDELDFLNGVSMGNLGLTKSMLDGASDERAKVLIRLNDSQERSPLEIAVENEHYDIVYYIVDNFDRFLGYQQVNESLMLAISKGYLNITQVLLEYSGFNANKNRARQTLGRHENFYDRNYQSKFDRDVTPIMMAAMCNEVEILRLLIERGNTVYKPHHPLCDCTGCSNRKEFDPLMHSLSIINAYRALSSEAYISLTSPDPILTAFLLSKELDDLAYMEKEFKNEYLVLQKKCKKYASDLLDMCQNTNEVKKILKQKATTYDEIVEQHRARMHTTTDEDDDVHSLPRLELAIKYRQKQFVAHPHCQHHLSTLWYQGLPGLRQMTKWKRFIFLPLFFCLLPFGVIGYLIYPFGKFGAFMRSPIIKFINQSGMYFTFLLLMFLESVTSESFQRESDTFASVDDFLKTLPPCHALAEALDAKEGEPFQLRTDTVTAVETCLMIFIVGMMWQEVKQIWDEGAKAYLSSYWNWIDITMLNLLVAAIITIYSTGSQALASRVYFSQNESCSALERGDAGALDHLYYLPSDRSKWRDDDPNLIAEGLFAMANVLSFSRLSFILPVTEFLGPLQISLGRMLGDILRFAAVFGVVFLAFFCAMCNLYWYYPSDSAFGSLSNALKTLMWALFGLGSDTDTECPEGQPDCGHVTTEVFGVILYASYQAVMVIVMLNMLIAMMSSSFDEINNDEDVEWKFSRSKLWMAYFGKGATLPMPFNIIPSLKSLYYALLWVRNKLRRLRPNKRMDARILSDKKQDAMRHAMKRSVVSHEDLMKNVVKRYLFQLQRSVETDEVDEGVLDEIKNDISSFRFDILDRLAGLSTKIEERNPSSSSPSSSPSATSTFVFPSDASPANFASRGSRTNTRTRLTVHQPAAITEEEEEDDEEEELKVIEKEKKKEEEEENREKEKKKKRKEEKKNNLDDEWAVINEMDAQGGTAANSFDVQSRKKDVNELSEKFETLANYFSEFRTAYNRVYDKTP